MPVSVDCLSICETVGNSGSAEHAGPKLTVGLINNMGDGALEATERQFLSLLEAASHGMPVRVLLFSLPEIPRGEAARTYLRRYYPLEYLTRENVDALIVTGREPTAERFEQETYWSSFRSVLAWARAHTHSAIFSCLAAHAAVFALDGIERVRSGHKHFGVLDCMRVGDHALAADLPARLAMPHSRWNGLPENRLMACGYEPLTITEDAGWDLFVKEDRSLFVFMQGHPEYDASTLMLEYRRDAGRYARGESATFPRIPRKYFDPATAAELLRIESQVGVVPAERLCARVSALLENVRVEHAWRSGAVSIYRKWLDMVRARKDAQRATDAPERTPGAASRPSAAVEVPARAA